MNSLIPKTRSPNLTDSRSGIALNGSLDYRTKVTIRVIRDVKLAPGYDGVEGYLLAADPGVVHRARRGLTLPGSACRGDRRKDGANPLSRSRLTRLRSR